MFQIPSRSKKNLLLTQIGPSDVIGSNASIRSSTAKRISATLNNDIDETVPGSSSSAAHLTRDHPPPVARPREPQWRPDVYVHAFVPESLTAINRSLCSVIDTPTIEGINFGKYISTFAGSQFLSTLSPLPFPEPQRETVVDSLALLKTANYKQYFEQCLALDLEARIPEIRSYDLFGATLQPRDRSQHLFSLQVPGIKEGTPLISFGDLVMLRQLVIDPVTGLPRGMHAWLALGGGRDRGEQAPGFTGYQLNAIVVGVDKANETLIIRAHGMIWAESIVCNVSFVVQARLVQSLQRAVANVAQEMPANVHALERTKIAEQSGKGPVHQPSVRTLQDGDHGDIHSTTVSRQQPRGRDDVDSMPQSPWLERVLFPKEEHGVRQSTLPSVTFSQDWADKNLNYEQKVRST